MPWRGQRHGRPVATTIDMQYHIRYRLGAAMSQRDKLVARIRARPPEADFGDVRALLEEFGWTLQRERGSHVIFVKPGERSIVVPKVGGRKVKRTYLAMLCERLGLDS